MRRFTALVRWSINTLRQAGVNALDKVYYMGGFALGTTFQLNTLVPGDLRTYALELRNKF